MHTHMYLCDFILFEGSNFGPNLVIKFYELQDNFVHEQKQSINFNMVISNVTFSFLVVIFCL